MEAALDKAIGTVKNNPIRVMQPCEHTSTVMIARRDGVDYMECLQCRQIFEAEDLEPVSVDEEEE